MVRVESLLLDAEGLAAELRTSKATVWRWDASGKLPKPLRLTGGTTRWRRVDIEKWIDLGCPNRTEFDELTKTNDGRPQCK